MTDEDRAVEDRLTDFVDVADEVMFEGREELTGKMSDCYMELRKALGQRALRRLRDCVDAHGGLRALRRLRDCVDAHGGLDAVLSDRKEPDHGERPDGIDP